MTQQPDHDTDIATLVSGLPRSIQPRRDLWPEVESRLDASPRPGIRAGSTQAPWRQLAMAASLVLMLGAGFLLGRQLPSASPAGPQAGLVEVADHDDHRLAEQLAYGLQREFQAAYRQLPAASDREWAPEVGRELVRNFELIDSAAADIRKAMELSPDDRHLAYLLAAAYQRQLRLAKQVATLHSDSRRTL